MGSYPTTPRAAFLEWCENHQDIFSDHSAAIGLSAAQALAFATAVGKAADAAKAQAMARQEADTATADAGDAFAALRHVAGDTMRLIRAFAGSAANPNAVYSIAQIPAPADPSPVPPPAQPTDLRVELDPASGMLTLRWKASNPSGSNGTSYIVRRKLPGEADFSFIGVSGSKKFIDTTLLAGPDMVQYTVQGQRSGLSGPLSPVFVVNFGRAPGGGVSVNVSSPSQPSAAPPIGGRFVATPNGNGNGNGASGRLNGQRGNYATSGV